MARALVVLVACTLLPVASALRFFVSGTNATFGAISPDEGLHGTSAPALTALQASTTVQSGEARMLLGGAYSQAQDKLFYSFVRLQPSTAEFTAGFPVEIYETRLGYLPGSDLGTTGTGVGTLVQHPPYYASNALVVDDANGHIYSFDMNISALHPLPTDPMVVMTTEVSSYLVRHDLDGSNRVVLAEGIFTFGGLYAGIGAPPTLWAQPRVAQLVDGVIYYLDAGHIGRINIDGSNHQVLFQGLTSQDFAPGDEIQMAVSASAGKIFFTAVSHWGNYNHDRLYWIPIEGSTERANLILAPEYVSYIGIVADDANSRLFVAGKLAQGQRLAVGTIDYNGVSRATLAAFETWQADALANDPNPEMGINGGFALLVKTGPANTEDQEWETLSLIDSILTEINEMQSTFNSRVGQLRTKVDKLRGRLSFAYDDVVTTGISLPSTTGSGGGPSLPTGFRNPLLQPYASNSIWNLPIGADAQYTPAQLFADFDNGANLQRDEDIVILTPDAQIQSVLEATGSWSNLPEGRCIGDGPYLFSAPLPNDFELRWECCTSDSAAILAENGRTVIQTSPFGHCNASSPWTTLNNWEQTDSLDGPGTHGRSNVGLSNLGGVIRVGELLNTTGPIQHALKIAIYGSVNFYPGDNLYRWPARWGYNEQPGQEFNGTVSDLVPGALLALLPSFDIEASVNTQPARKIAQALQDYGAYANANSFSPSIRLYLENGPFGNTADEFQAFYGFPFDTQWNSADPWQQDMQTIFSNLQVITNWDEAAYTTVAASTGSQGAGGGSPRVPWAPALDSEHFV